MSVTAPDDAFLDVNDAHLRVFGNVHADGLKLGQLEVVTTTSTGSTIQFLHQHTAFTTTSNIEVGSSNLFVDTNTSRVGILTNTPTTALDVNGTVKATAFDGDGALLTGIPSSAINGTLSQWTTVTGPKIHYSDGNVGIGIADPLHTLDVVWNAHVTTDLSVGGTLSINTITAAATHALSAVTAVGASTGDTLQLTNATTGLVTTGNVEVGKDLTVAGNVAVDTDTLFVDSVNNRVGVGTTDPKIKLHLYDTTTEPTIAIQHLTSNENNSSTNVLGNICLHRSHRSGIGNQVGIRSIRRANTWDDQADMEFYVRNGGYGEQTAMVINSGSSANSAKIGIGTDDPKVALHVRATDGRLAIADASENDCDTNAFNVGLFFVDNTWTGSVLHSGNPSNGMGFYIAHNSSSSKNISMRNMCGSLTFGTRNDTVAMSIDDDGNVGIGTTSPNWPLEVTAGDNSITHYGPNTTWGGRLAVGAANDKTAASDAATAQCIVTNGNLHLDAADTRDIYMNHYRGAYIRHNGSGLFSDDRLKSEEELITNATDTLLKLSPQKYLKRRTLREDETRDPLTETGLIAQDIWYDAPELRHIVLLGTDASPVEIKPEAPVEGDIQQDPDYSSWGPNEASVNYDGLIAYLIKSNQELHARIKALENA